jgi:hypothetical protein
MWQSILRARLQEVASVRKLTVLFIYIYAFWGGGGVLDVRCFSKCGSRTTGCPQAISEQKEL